MSGGVVSICGCRGELVPADVPEYCVELECYRLLREREQKVPCRGSREYHEVMERLSAEIHRNYFQNPSMYDHGHLWCPMCGCRLGHQEEALDI